jgi:O-antigen biosynthesis protein
MKSKKLNFLSRYIRSVRCVWNGNDTFSAVMPPPLSAGWYLIWLRYPASDAQWLVRLRLQGGDTASEVVLAKPFGWNVFGLKLGVFFLSSDRATLTADLFGTEARDFELWLRFVRLARPLASIGVVLQNLPIFRAKLASGSGALPSRFREAVTVAARDGQSFPKAYADWLRLFGDLRARAGEHVCTVSQDVATISALVCSGQDDFADNLHWTIESLATQSGRPHAVISRRGTQGRESDGASYVAILRAGEQLVPHALQIMSQEIEAHGFPDILYADEDQLNADCVRFAPVFKPQPNVLLMCSGTLSTGVWVVRRDLLPENLTPLVEKAAETLRLQLWFRAFLADGARRTFRIPYVLTSRHIATEPVPAAELSVVVKGFLQEAGISASVSQSYPLRLQWTADEAVLPKVSLLVASKLEGETQLSCMLSILTETAYPNLEMIIVVTQNRALTPHQQQMADRLSVHKNVRVHVLQEQNFNYSKANNVAASLSNGEFVCLLNDDVSPLDGSWLKTMVAMFSVRGCGAVGPKLLYPDQTVQHGGIILGLAGTVEHAHRNIDRNAPGYAWRASLDQEMSAVTGACILLRRSTFDELGGLDEKLPTAFNDIDFCLRLRELGLSVIYAGSAEMIHHETITFGKGHYDATKAAKWDADVALFAGRWNEICQADPFHNPNLSLAPNSEWQLAFPPRHLTGECPGSNR